LGPGKFLVALEWGSKGKTLPLDCEQLEGHIKLKFCSELHTINVGSWNFIQINWPTWLSYFFKFSGKSLKFLTFRDSPTNDIFSISRKHSSKIKYIN
jgi:hypothetical protein